jgi:hypothetical protein
MEDSTRLSLPTQQRRVLHTTLTLKSGLALVCKSREIRFRTDSRITRNQLQSRYPMRRLPHLCEVDLEGVWKRAPGPPEQPPVDACRCREAFLLVVALGRWERKHDPAPCSWLPVAGQTFEVRKDSRKAWVGGKSLRAQTCIGLAVQRQTGQIRSKSEVVATRSQACLM